MKVAVLGFGTVGVGVYEMLQVTSGLEAGPVLVRIGKDDAPFKVTSMDAILNDKTVDAVVEVMGGVEPAFTYVSAALSAGKHVVTSNKALVAAHGVELNELVINEDEAPIVRMMFEKYVTEGCGPQRMANYLRQIIVKARGEILLPRAGDRVRRAVERRQVIADKFSD